MLSAIHRHRAHDPNGGLAAHRQLLAPRLATGNRVAPKYRCSRRHMGMLPDKSGISTTTYGAAVGGDGP